MNIIEIRKQKNELQEHLVRLITDTVDKARPEEIVRETKPNSIIHKLKGIEFIQNITDSGYNTQPMFSVRIEGKEFFIKNADRLFQRIEEAYQEIQEINNLTKTIGIVRKYL